MKRHVQLPGVRKWSGNDLIDLQSEPFKALDGFFGQFGAMILTGCQIVDKEIKPGIVVLPELIADKTEYKLATFKGATVVQFPVYMTLEKAVISRDYENATVQPIAYNYEAIVVQNKPADTPYFIIESNNNKTFTEAIQNEYRRFVTEEQIKEWSTPRDFIASTSIDNLDEFKKSGFHSFECEGGEGTPIVGGFRGFSIMEEDELFGTQVAFSTIRPEIFVRTLEDDTWGKWVKIWTSKSLKISKDDKILGIKPFLPIRPAKGDAYMLNNRSSFYQNPNSSDVPMEIYRFMSYSKSNRRQLVGDSSLEVHDSKGNKIKIEERMVEENQYIIPLNKNESVTTMTIPIISKENLIVLSGRLSRTDVKLSIDTYTHTSFINTIVVPLETAQRTTPYAFVVFSDNVKSIKLRIDTTVADVNLKSIKVFGYSGLRINHRAIYRFDPDEGWNMEKVSGNVVQVKGRDYELRKSHLDFFDKVFTVNVPKIEFKGVDESGNIHITPVYGTNNLYVRLFIKKRKRHASGDPGEIKWGRPSVRYVEITKAHMGDCIMNSVTKTLLFGNNILPYTFSDIYHTAFKVYKDGRIKRTNGLTERAIKGVHDIKYSYADVALCLTRRVNGVYVNGEMAYFRIQGKNFRVK